MKHYINACLKCAALLVRQRLPSICLRGRLRGGGEPLAFEGCFRFFEAEKATAERGPCDAAVFDHGAVFVAFA
ncbi:hypothetical protein SB861_65130, partial [Paraburkholderia sp. SIMBA_049]